LFSTGEIAGFPLAMRRSAPQSLSLNIAAHWCFRRRAAGIEADRQPR